VVLVAHYGKNIAETFEYSGAVAIEIDHLQEEQRMPGIELHWAQQGMDILVGEGSPLGTCKTALFEVALVDEPKS
jgi:hypothetical protein